MPSLHRVARPDAAHREKRSTATITTTNPNAAFRTRPPLETQRVFGHFLSGGFTIYFDAALTQRSLCTLPGDTVRAYVVLENAGEVRTVRFRLDTNSDPSLIWLRDIAPIPGTSVQGRSFLNIKLNWSPLQQASGQLHILTVEFLDNAGCSNCTIPARPLATTGALAWRDLNGLWHSAGGATSFSCYEGPLSDIDAISLSAPVSALTNDNISTVTSVTLTNAGPDSTQLFTVGVFHSVNPVVTPSDLLLTNGTSAPLALAPGDTVTVSFPGLTLPSPTPLGTGFLGIIADYSGAIPETDETNNALVAPITVDSSSVNLTLRTMATPSAVELGQDIRGLSSILVNNLGTANSGAFDVSVVISPDTVITTDDLLLVGGTESVSTGLAAGAFTQTFFTGGLTIPPNSPTGNVYLGVLIDPAAAVNEFDETDNAFFAPVFVDSNYVDLVISEFIAPSTAALGQSIEADTRVTIKNIGIEAAGPFNLRLLHTTLDSVTIAGPLLRSTPVTGLAPGDSAVFTFPGLTIDVLSTPGNSYLVATADANNAVQERFESNNAAYSLLTVGATGDTVCVYHEDFAAGDGGWTPVNLTAQTGIYWHVANNDSSSTLSGLKSMVCSTEDSVLIAPGVYRTWKGYGSSWKQILRRTFTRSATGIDIVSFDFDFDLEPGFDFVYVRIRPVGSTEQTILASYSGKRAGTESLVLTQYPGVDIEFEFYFESDTSRDDSDGLFRSQPPSVGFDNFSYSSLGVETFENGLMNGWDAMIVGPTPGGYRRVENPVCFPGFAGCDTTYAGAPFAACGVWVPYDNVTGEFPYRPRGVNDFAVQNIAIESPVISLPADGTRYLVDCDAYLDLGVGAQVFLTMEYTFDGSTWLNQGNYWGDFGWTHVSIDITADALAALAVNPSPSFAIRWGSVEDSTFAFTGPTPGPYIDNVSVKVAGTSSPGVSCVSSCSATAAEDLPMTTFVLLQNSPNPFNPATTIAFSLVETVPVSLVVYDLAGRQVRTLLQGELGGGAHEVRWNGTDDSGRGVASGVYLYELVAGSQTLTRKMLLLK